MSWDAAGSVPRWAPTIAILMRMSPSLGVSGDSIVRIVFACCRGAILAIDEP